MRKWRIFYACLRIATYAVALNVIPHIYGVHSSVGQCFSVALVIALIGIVHETTHESEIQ